ncbi:putative lipoyltransferase 2, mitochondrial [Centruroides sculpturatus]|uniref:putative lipoyltransferase 2, mitochondrial n=1 Tax=Centruroides sculpturatus TaxID=218467 RepID=UPI000C6DE2F2|nr:putative lipoyltransferase 2, mitochondrial [Centruroides sculpturatus]
MFNVNVILHDLGRISFGKALQLQNHACRQLLNSLKTNTSRNNYLFICEHLPVYTIGIRKEYNDDDEKRLRSLGADYMVTNRGGLITFHGPGQLVAYPVLYLGDFNNRKSMKWYIQKLEMWCIRLCKKFGLNASTSVHTGVWIEDRKIAAIGVHGSRYVTTHGLALNCNTDLEWFKHIIPCGIPNKEVTSLTKELGQEITTDQVKPEFLNIFEELFQCKLIKDNL